MRSPIVFARPVCVLSTTIADRSLARAQESAARRDVYTYYLHAARRIYVYIIWVIHETRGGRGEGYFRLGGAKCVHRGGVCYAYARREVCSRRYRYVRLRNRRHRCLHILVRVLFKAQTCVTYKTTYAGLIIFRFHPARV